MCRVADCTWERQNQERAHTLRAMDQHTFDIGSGGRARRVAKSTRPHRKGPEKRGVFRHTPPALSGHPKHSVRLAEGAGIQTIGVRPEKAGFSAGFTTPDARIQGTWSLPSPSLVQPSAIRHAASSADISTMRSSPIVICRFDKV